MPLELKHIPNAICIVRILLVAPIIWCLVNDRYGLGLGLIIIAGLSDALDGFLAYASVERRLAPRTLDAYGRDLARFAGFLNTRVHLEPPDSSTPNE